MNIYIYIPNKIILVCNLSSILMTGSVDCFLFVFLQFCTSNEQAITSDKVIKRGKQLLKTSCQTILTPSTSVTAFKSGEIEQSKIYQEPKFGSDRAFGG